MGVVYKKHYKFSRARYIGMTEYYKKNPAAMHHKCRSFPLINFSYKYVSRAPLFQNIDYMVTGVLFLSSFCRSTIHCVPLNRKLKLLELTNYDSTLS